MLLVLSLTYWEHPASHSAILLGMSVSQAHWFEAQFSLSELHAAQRSNWWPPILGLQPDWGFLWHLALQKRRKKTYKHTLKRSLRNQQYAIGVVNTRYLHLFRFNPLSLILQPCAQENIWLQPFCKSVSGQVWLHFLTQFSSFVTFCAAVGGCVVALEVSVSDLFLKLFIRIQ